MSVMLLDAKSVGCSSLNFCRRPLKNFLSELSLLEGVESTERPPLFRTLVSRYCLNFYLQSVLSPWYSSSRDLEKTSRES